MRSKVIFFVLLMLSFTIVHDSVINTLHADEEISITHYTEQDLPSQECSNEGVDEIHGMFHFVGLAIPFKSSFIQLPIKQARSYHAFNYTSTYQETSDKPPKA